MEWYEQIVIDPRILVGILDTGGYGADRTQKYNGMSVLEGKLSIGGQAMSTGACGFGIKRPVLPARGPATILVYDIAGEKVAYLSATLDSECLSENPVTAEPVKSSDATIHPNVSTLTIWNPILLN
jgi:hypothetical protein